MTESEPLPMDAQNASLLRFTVLWLSLSWKNLEARAGIEPAHKGFADLSLTTWVPRLGPGRKPELLHSAVHLVDCCRGDAEWSGRRDLNSRPSPWQGDALPLSYSRLTQIRVYRSAETGSNYCARRQLGLNEVKFRNHGA